MKNVPSFPLEVAEICLGAGDGVPIPQIFADAITDFETAVRHTKELGKFCARSEHFYLDDLSLYWDVDFRGIDLSEARFPFPVTGLFYTFDNRELGIDKRTGSDEHHRHKCVTIVFDLPDAIMVHAWFKTIIPGNPEIARAYPEGFGWQMAPAAAVIDRNYLVDSGEIIRQDEAKFRTAPPVNGLDWDLCRKLYRDANLPESHLANVIADDVRIALGFLAISNASNVPRIRTDAPAKLNKKRAKHGKLPLQSYHVLDLTFGQGKDYHRSNGAGNERESPRLHLRRGHIRRLASGLTTYVRPTMVGDASKGVVHKDYHPRRAR